MLGRLEPPANAQTVEFGQHRLDQRHIRKTTLERFDSELPVRGYFDLEARLDQRLAQHLDAARLVVDQQYRIIRHARSKLRSAELACKNIGGRMPPDTESET